MSLNTQVIIAAVEQGTPRIKEEVKELLKNLFHNLLKDHYDGRNEIYALNNERHTYQVGLMERHVTFTGATNIGEETTLADGEPLQEVDIEYKRDHFRKIKLLPPSIGAKPIEVNGHIVASFSQHQLDIHFDPFDALGGSEDAHIDSVKRLLLLIVKAYREQYISRLDEQYSWKNEEAREVLRESVKQQSLATFKREERHLKEKEEQYSSDIRELQIKIKRQYDNLLFTRRKLVGYADGGEGIADKVMSQLSLVAEHERISDVQIRDNQIKIFVPNVIATDKNDHHYYIGNMAARIDMATSTVKFEGDNPRQSYWSPNDPHPHVDGRSGDACLGNVSSTIAELSSANEIYALALVAIDFMENVNIDDAAGRRVRNWDRVQADGSPLPVDEEAKVRARKAADETTDEDECESCGDEDDLYAVYENYSIINSRIVGSERRDVCNSCRNDSYTYWESAGAYINNDHEELQALSQLAQTQIF